MFLHYMLFVQQVLAKKTVNICFLPKVELY